jgi:hypothetical protein
MTIAEKPDKILTQQGLAMKSVGKIERINCDATNEDATLRTWQLSRIVRRDFYLVSYKMFFAMRQKGGKSTVLKRLADVREEAEVLKNMTQHFELPVADTATVLSLRLIDEESRILLEALVTVDKAFAKMKENGMGEVADENCGPYFAAYVRLKNFAINFNKDPRYAKATEAE